MLVLWLQSGFVLVLALLAMSAAKRLPSLRLAIARVALLAAVGLSICLPWLGSREAPVVPVTFAAPAPLAAAATPKPAAPRPENAAPAGESVIAPTNTSETTRTLNPLAAAAGIWALGVAFLSIHLGIGYGALARIRRSARRVSDPVAQDMLASVAKAAQVKTPWLMESNQVGTPFVAGAMRPTIFIPAGWTSSVEPETLRAVLSHEVAHIANGDIRWALLHRAITTLLWPQPLLWLLKKPMAAASEELCDQHVLASGIPQDRYADCLLNLKESLARRPAPSLGIGAFSSKSQLGKRIEALMDPRRSRLKLSRKGTFLLRASAIAIAIGATIIFASPARSAWQDPFAKWIKEPYSASVQIQDQAGKPYGGPAKAFLVVNGSDRTNKLIEVPVKGGKVALDGSQGKGSSRGSLVVKAPGKGLAFIQLWPTPKEATAIQVGAAGSLKGRFLLPDSKPAAGLTVRANLFVEKGKNPTAFLMLPQDSGVLGIQTKTDANGRYSLEGLPANVSVGLALDDPRFAMLTYEQRGETSTGSMGDIQLQLGVRFSGQVLRDGKPVEGVVVAAQENHDKAKDYRGDWAETITDSQGRYTLHGLGTSHYNIALDLTGALAQEVNAPAHEGVKGVAGQVTSNLDFHLAPGAVIEGTVFDSGGRPMANAMIGCYGPAHPNSSAWVQTASTNANGRYRLRVPPGKQIVYWMVENGSDQHRVTVSDGQRLTLDILTGGTSSTEEQDGPPPPAIETRPLVKPANPQSASYGPGAPNYGPIKLKSGLTARIAFVQDDSAGAHTIWRPDGSAAPSADVQRSLNMTGFSRGKQEHRSVFVRLDVDGAQPGEFSCLADVPHKSNWTVWQTYGETDGDRSMNMATFQAPYDLVQTDLRVGISAGPFKPYATWRPGERTNLPIKIGPAEQIDIPNAPRSTATVTLEVPPSMNNTFMRFEAFDSQGRALRNQTLSVRNEVNEKTGVHWRYCTFTGGELSEVSLVKISTRDYEWVTFKGLRLYPNK